MSIDRNERYTYRQYRTWPEGERWELIEGQAWNMSPAPRVRHQAILVKLLSRIFDFLEGKPCQVFGSPFDVLLPEGDESDEEVDTVVQPDIVVYCDRSKINEFGARGAPDLAVEILSPSTSKKDLREKFNLYERHSVREYWVVDPGNKSIIVFRPGSDGKYDEGELRDLLYDASPLASKVLEGFAVDPVELFAKLD
jgi:Uma2 family endonuclease